jgi:hypothetical protein
MKEQFLDYRQAFHLKELGFDEPCFGYYESDETLQIIKHPSNQDNRNSLFLDCNKTNNVKISAPTKWQCLKWFREKHGLNYFIDCVGPKDGYQAFVDGYIYSSFLGEKCKDDYPICFTYENAEIACIERMFELVRKKV